MCHDARSPTSARPAGGDDDRLIALHSPQDVLGELLCWICGAAVPVQEQFAAAAGEARSREVGGAVATRHFRLRVRDAALVPVDFAVRRVR